MAAPEPERALSEAEAARVRARGRVGLGVAATSISVLGLAGPLMLLTTGDASPVAPFYPFGWLIAIGGLVYWLRAWRAATRPPEG